MFFRPNDVVFEGTARNIVKDFPTESFKKYFVARALKSHFSKSKSEKSKGKLLTRWRNLVQQLNKFTGSTKKKDKLTNETVAANSIEPQPIG